MIPNYRPIDRRSPNVIHFVDCASLRSRKISEQSIASARNALANGADLVEMDIQYTKDGMPVVCHDPNAKRLFGEDKLVADMTYEHFMTLRQVKDKAFSSHSLANVLESGVHPVLFHCKISGNLLKDLSLRLRDAEFESKSVIGVLNPEDVEIVKGVANIPVLSFMPSIGQLEGFLASRADFIRLWEDWVTQERIDSIHAKGKKVWVMAGKSTPAGVGYTTEEKLRNGRNWRRRGFGQRYHLGEKHS